MTNAVFGPVLPWVLIAFGTWILHQLARQNGRILLRLESIEARIGPRESPRAMVNRPERRGLPLGTEAPDFELPDLRGSRHKLSDFREQDVLLIFFNPQCGYCMKMTADLAALPVGGGDQEIVPIVVTTGDREENRKLVEQYDIRCLVLIQDEMNIASLFRVQGTPMGYRIDRAGRIASELAVGAEPLLELATPIETKPAESIAHANGSAPCDAKPDPSLARSRLNRNGLRVGTVAPDFRLPRIDAGEISLTDLRGRRILLVFSDPDCGPCDELAPRLQEIHRQRRDLDVLMVSRRNREASLAKASALGLTFPIVLQQNWEISMKYAKFATPIGYLIDEQGVLASDVAVGVGPILVIAGEGAPGSDPSRSSHSNKKPVLSN